MNWPNNYVVIDIETTGIEYDKFEIIEIGIIKVKDGKIVNRFNKLVKPKNDPSDFITKLTGITSKMLVNEKSIKSVVNKVKSFVGNSLVMGYNLNNFDLPFLAHNGIEFKANQKIDVLEVSRDYLDLSNYKQKTVAKHLLNVKQSHRAIADCELTHSIYQKIRKDNL